MAVNAKDCKQGLPAYSLHGSSSSSQRLVAILSVCGRGSPSTTTVVASVSFICPLPLPLSLRAGWQCYVESIVPHTKLSWHVLCEGIDEIKKGKEGR